MGEGGGLLNRDTNGVFHCICRIARAMKMRMRMRMRMTRWRWR